ncbi:MAG: hypothetical protein P4M11_09090 [Candidatus Pacebacteria bacterium]|nr:hypothetical protein [Candidatus Paceibacterota bacterium]
MEPAAGTKGNKQTAAGPIPARSPAEEEELRFSEGPQQTGKSSLGQRAGWLFSAIQTKVSFPR